MAKERRQSDTRADRCFQIIEESGKVANVSGAVLADKMHKALMRRYVDWFEQTTGIIYIDGSGAFREWLEFIETGFPHGSTSRQADAVTLMGLDEGLGL